MSRGIQYNHTPEYVANRPRLRGVLHLAMVPFAVAMAVSMYTQTSGPSRVTGGIFGVLFIGLYAVSGAYHVPAWTGRVRMFWGRVDTAMIVLFIAGTFTPIAFHALDGAWRFWSLVVAWSIAVVGSAMALSPLTVPRWIRTAGYLAVGWLMVVPFVKIAQALPAEGTALIIIGGVLYTIGGVVYASEKPDPAPEWFGVHEVFHLLVVAASVCHYVAITRYIL